MSPFRLFPRAALAFAILVQPKVLLADNAERVPPPPAEIDPGPPPHARAPTRSRRPVEVAPEARWSLPACGDGSAGERCRALGAALGGALVALYRPNPYFSFGAGVSYRRSAERHTAEGPLSGNALGIGADARVYLYEEGVFDPYLELHLGYAWLRTALFVEGTRVEEAAFGPEARVGGGVEFVASSSLRLGGAIGSSHLFLARGERCVERRCIAGGAPGAAALSSFEIGLRASLLFGKPL